MTPPWIDTFHAYAGTNQDEEAIDLLFEKIDDMLLDDQMAEVDRLLALFELEKLSINLLVGLLSITLSAREFLPSRPELVDRVRALVWRRDPLRAERIMKGLS